MGNFLLRTLLLLSAMCLAAPVAHAQAWRAEEGENEELAPRPRAPVLPDDRPYDNKLIRLSEILGAVHYLRALCGGDEGQLWRKEMQAIVEAEGTTAVRRAKLVNSFNNGYRGYRRTYRACTPSASTAISRFMEEGETLARSLAENAR